MTCAHWCILSSRFPLDLLTSFNIQDVQPCLSGKRTGTPLPFQLWGMSSIPPINPSWSPESRTFIVSASFTTYPPSFFPFLLFSSTPPALFSLLGTEPRPHAYQASPLTTGLHPGPSLPPGTPLPQSAHWCQQSRKGSFVLKPGFYIRVTSFALHSCGSDLGLWPLATRRPLYRTILSRNTDQAGL